MSFKSFLSKFSLLFISVFLFAISASFTSWIVYLPVLFLVHYIDLKYSWLWGGIYGFLSYFFYAFWLVFFNIPASIGVFVFYFILLAILFFLLKLCDLFFCEKAYLFQWILICAFEYLKTVEKYDLLMPRRRWKYEKSNFNNSSRCLFVASTGGI